MVPGVINPESSKADPSAVLLCHHHYGNRSLNKKGITVTGFQTHHSSQLLSTQKKKDETWKKKIS